MNVELRSPSSASFRPRLGRFVSVLLLGLFCLTASAQNLLVNGDFATIGGNGLPASWSYDAPSIMSVDTGDHPAGASRSLQVSLPMNGGSSLGQIWQSLSVASSGTPLRPNTSYVARVWLKSSNSGDGRLEIKRYDGSNTELERIDSTRSSTGWTQVQVAFNTGAAARVDVLLRYAKDNTSAGEEANFALAEVVNVTDSTLGAITLVPTFESLGVYVPINGAIATGANGHTVEISYRITGTSTWIPALSADASIADNEFRSSILQLQPNTSYEVQAVLKLAGTQVDSAQSQPTSTWKETATLQSQGSITTDTTLAASSSSMLTITGGGTDETHWVRYKAATGGSTIDVGSSASQAIYISNAHYVIIDGLTLKGGKNYGILVENSHHIRIQNCTISGWSEAGTFGPNADQSKDTKWAYFFASPYTSGGPSPTLINLRGAVYVKGTTSAQVVIDRNLIYNPIGKSPSWGIIESGQNHPAGPEGVVLDTTGGNHVIRNNDMVAGDGHFFNDVIEGSQNSAINGGPAHDTDINGNLLVGANDDGTELDGGQKNVRFWNNVVEINHSGISTVPVLQGPSYIFRNIFVGGDERGITEDGFKLGGVSGIAHFLNNTVYTPNYAFTGGHSFGSTTTIFTRNNIFTGPVNGNAPLRYDKSSSYTVLGDTDYDLTPVGGINAASPGDKEPHRVEGYPSFANAKERSFLLLPGTVGIAAGTPVATVTPSGVSNPDMGAVTTATALSSWPLRANTPDLFPLRTVVRLRENTTTSAGLQLTAPTATGATWKALSGAPWLTLSPSTGNTGSSPIALVCSVNASGLSRGTHNSLVSVRTNTGALRTALFTVEVLPATDHVFVKEAEVGLPTGAAFESLPDASASGGAYAHAISTGTNNIVMNFTVPAAEEYYVHARVRMDGPSAQQPNQNSLFLTIAGETDEWDFAGPGIDWSWDTARVPRAAVTDRTGPILLAAGPTEIQIGKRSGGVQIDTIVVSNSPYPPRVAAPSFSPAGGTYGGAQSVTISTATSGATLRYTTDGSLPTRAHGTVYSGPVSIGATTTLRAIAYKDQMEDADISSDIYTIGGGAGTFQMSGNQVTMEAEHYSSTTAGDGHSWTLATASGAVGGASDNAIQAMPNTGTGYPTFTSVAARTDYAINVPSGSASNFYVHLRAFGATTTDDSVYLSIDGSTTTVLELDILHSLSWKTSTSTLALPTGAHTLTVWMREDGAILDRIVLSTSSTAPTGNGPAESVRN
ncbi:MAG TPA: chitobiase/beta-hexosaminidase C-terminal domain-containing protein [Opitutaceae bacterium]|nr:chitobiase/beta-hexosaminidase C-terminal domain-containing protein [Opitutaceae bacterium]